MYTLGEQWWENGGGRSTPAAYKAGGLKQICDAGMECGVDGSYWVPAPKMFSFWKTSREAGQCKYEYLNGIPT